jgi:AraC family transcriptional regulator
MPGRFRDDGLAVTPQEQLRIASVRPTTSDGLGWSGLRAEHLSNPPDAEVDVPPTTHHWLIYHPSHATTFSLRFAGRERTEAEPLGSLTIIPAGYPTRWRWRGAADSVHVLVEPWLLARVGAEALDLNPDRIEVPPVHDLSHAHLRDTVLALDAEMRAGGPGGRLLAESLGNVLAVHLLRHFGVPGSVNPQPGGVLPRHKLGAVVEYIEAHLDAELSLDRLAAVAHVSPYHFARLFKHSTGLPPHQYVIARRVERAKELLRDRDRLPLAEVATEVGFADQSHFTRHFRRLVGITPRHFR